jgi:hypothetical protein
LKTRILLGGLAALAVMAFGAASASATTISPQGPIAPLSNATNFKIFNLPITCSTSTIPGTVNANGTITGGKPTFAGCNSGIGAVEITANQALHYAVGFNPLGVGTEGVATTLSDISLNFKFVTHGCSITVGGSESTFNKGLSPLTITSLAFSNAPTSTTRASMYVTGYPAGNSFCSSLFAQNPSVAFASTYTLSPSLVVSR